MSEPIRVAFVCVQNAGRSQISTAIAEQEVSKRGLDDEIEIITGGTDPADSVHDVVIEVMSEEGIDLSDRVPRSVTDEELETCDYVATMGCSTLDLDVDVRDWALPDPDGADLDAVRELRETIRTNVRALFDEIETEISQPDADGTATDGGFDAATQRRIVRERYADVASEAADADESCGDSCCGDDQPAPNEAAARARDVGYEQDDLDDDVADANLGLGCGNPQAIANLSTGETVLDLGSGAGFDCFLAAREVGPSGQVIGVDMTPEMIEQARENADDSEFDHVEFRLGEIEHLPVADETVDVVISNCVVNLSPDKAQVFREAYRALRPGGRVAIADVVLTADVPAELRADPDSVAACVAGAARIERVEQLLADAGFEAVEIEPKDDSESFIREWDDDHDVSEFLVAARITARKPE